jgi:uncharacterized membrane protein
MRLFYKLGEVLFAGLLVLLPIYLTIQVLVWIFLFVDKSVGTVFEPLFGRYVYGTGVVATFLVVFLAGLLTRWWLTQRLLTWVEEVVLRVPGLGQLYHAIKRLLDPLARKEDRPFREAVWVKVSDGLIALGFITSNELDTGEPDGEGRVSVFLPSCHPYFGMVTLARREDLRPAPVQLDEAVSYEFAFGAAPPPGVKMTDVGATKDGDEAAD